MKNLVYYTKKEEASIQCCVAIDLKIQLSIGFKNKKPQTL